MSQQNPQDWEQRLKELEAEINQEAEPNPVRPFNIKEESNSYFLRFTSWYQSLSSTTKVIVSVVGVIVTLSILNSVLRFISSLIVVGILGAVFVGLYKAFVTDKSSK
ncbi:MAG TPA: hypothetical protein DCF68_13850 [Cyanothece sp. UBA12306]|nr:hypothetical protein [Cyanothece sp. UBA12306]